MLSRLAGVLFVVVLGCGSQDPGEDTAAALNGDGEKSSESCVATLH